MKAETCDFELHGLASAAPPLYSLPVCLGCLKRIHQLVVHAPGHCGWQWYGPQGSRSAGPLHFPRQWGFRSEGKEQHSKAPIASANFSPPWYSLEGPEGAPVTLYFSAATMSAATSCVLLPLVLVAGLLISSTARGCMAPAARCWRLARRLRKTF